MSNDSEYERESRKTILAVCSSIAVLFVVVAGLLSLVAGFGEGCVELHVHAPYPALTATAEARR